MWMNVGMKFIFMLVTTAAAESWDFQWPYGENNSCVCQEVEPLGDYYTSQSDCLRAFAADEYQWCFYEDQGITDSQCDGVVAIAEGMDNDSCRAMCTGLVTRDTPIDDFSKLCKFNFHADFGDEVATGWSSCYSNMVYGWSDYDPTSPVQITPLKVLREVEGPTQCQTLCQAVEGCVYWSWRGYPDTDIMTEDGFQNEAWTCLLFDSYYMEGVLNTVMPMSDIFAAQTPFCNMPAKPECLVDPFNQPSFTPFEPYDCLICDCIPKCAWKSSYHLTGPAFCLPEYRDECMFDRPPPTTTPVPETTTTTVALESSTPAESSTTVELEGSTEEEILFSSTPDIGTMGTATTIRPGTEEFTTEEGGILPTTTEMPPTGGTSTTTRGPGGPGTECPDCPCEDCDEPEVYVDCPEPCDECMEE
eukprot:Protomagalhaensia_sp_Gyna_25__1118@NODE_1546_length_1749_cov_1644_269006_g1254_i0_p1_GENE_NODE_1546_length_1749_cov_1644_269006_g1254_i0NODE_1546_length_1749_cov_1644_269006_g1254_i0_p1_ORF_typecomplete_len443_score75_59PAN_4/PF14295_6/1_6e03PAN_4/PF14295_6/3_2e06_NODE_1546_length_1749_cov_1644_269006_g1254_i0791329